jgi:hypothetical protein
MAKATFNPWLIGVSGKSGDLVFRKHKKQTVVAQLPRKMPGPATPRQLLQREQFKSAQIYARKILSDDLQREAYLRLAKAQDRRVNKIIESDFLLPPIVDRIDLKQYTGRAGGMIRVLAHDDLEVVAVFVTIETKDGIILEGGTAAKSHDVWRYLTMTDVPEGKSLTITATAADRPGNSASLSVSWP